MINKKLATDMLLRGRRKKKEQPKKMEKPKGLLFAGKPKEIK